MANKTFGLIIGYLNVVLCAIATCFYLYMIIAISTGAADTSDINHDKGIVIGSLIFMLVILIAMIIVSVLLIMGIKKDRPSLMAPWVYLSIAGIIINIIRLFTGVALISSIVTIIIQCAIWYPIFKLYREMRAQKLNQNSVAATAPPKEYNQVPQHV